MTLVSELELPQLDYTDPGLRGERFHTVMRELRERSWIAASPLGYFVLDREAATHFQRSRSAVFPGAKVAELFGVSEGPLHEELSRNILNLEGADHRRLRNLVNPAFTPRAADRWRPAMRRYVRELFERVAGAGRCEFVGEFAKPYPSLVIATVMGAPLEDAGRLHEWSNVIQRQFATDVLEQRPLIERAIVEFYAYAEELLAARRTTPGDDLISTLIAAEEEGDRLSDVECINLVLNVLVGGVDTTQSQLAHSIRLFAAHPDQWRALAAEPALAPRAVEEVLRFEPITPFTARLLVEEVEYRGVTFPEGTLVVVSAVTANRDPADHDEPERFDITVDRGNARPLTFGAGIHYCLGANLARAELQEALAFLSRHMSDLRLDGEPQLDSVHGIYGVTELPIRFTATAAPSPAAAPRASA